MFFELSRDRLSVGFKIGDQVIEDAFVSRCDESHRCSLVPSSACPTCPVHVILNCSGTVIIYDKSDPFDVQASTCQVCSYKYFESILVSESYFV
jgi:hypothetical protein